MAQASLTQEDIKILEQLRQRLSQLTNNIASQKSDLIRSNPLPPWVSLQTSASILAGNIESLTNLMARHSELLNRMVVYPSTNYPGRTQEGILTQLLRKKLEPQVETWVEEGRTTQTQIMEGRTDEKSEDELLDWAKDWIGNRVVKYAMEEAGDNYTIEEREQGITSVNTGLKRNLEEDESDEDENEDEDEEMEDVGVAVTTVRRTSAGQVEFGLGELKKDLNAQSRSFDEILRFGASGRR
ncbi:RNA polymerase II mediator complex component Med8 [Diplocarpon rosae]|nr:RNA polymerase II mediator complex component Med8 [Diplocarpon rosae]